MPPKVSVVVPVYNPGEHIRPLIDSLLRQSLPPSEFEAIFVDDGSTDTTPALLDRLASEHDHISVIHQPNSGWPGKPRNVGIDAAKGEFVFFSDNDDWFGDEALERMYDAAVREGADIVIGKMVGHDRGVPRELFRVNRPHATFENAPLQDSLTPHKLFRREWLNEHGIRFPEGKRRLEDHVFVMRAYFAARDIYVLSDYDCYHHIGRPDESNAGYSGIEPVSYYGFVRETVDIVLANTEPGVVRDRLLRRFLRVEVLARLEGRRFTNLPPDRQRALFDSGRALVVETMPESVDAGLPGRQRLVAQLLRAGDLDAVARLATWSIGVGAGVTQLAWESGAIQVTWSARAGRGLLSREGERWLLHPPVGGAVFDVTGDVAKAKVDLIAIEPDRGEVILATTGSFDVSEQGHLTATGVGTVTFAGGAAGLSAGRWTLRLRVRAFGWVADSAPLRWPRGQRRPGMRLLGQPATLVRPSRTQRGAVLLDVGGRARWLDPDFAVATSAVARGEALMLEIPAVVVDADEVDVLVGAERLPAAVRPTPAPERTTLAVPPGRSAGGEVQLVVAGRPPLPLGFTVADGRPRRPAGAVARLRTAQLKRSGSFAVGSAKSLGNRARAAAARAARSRLR